MLVALALPDITPENSPLTASPAPPASTWRRLILA
jgi:hypothetical protein